MNRAMAKARCESRPANSCERKDSRNAVTTCCATSSGRRAGQRVTTCREIPCIIGTKANSRSSRDVKDLSLFVVVRRSSARMLSFEGFPFAALCSVCRNEMRSEAAGNADSTGEKVVSWRYAFCPSGPANCLVSRRSMPQRRQRQCDSRFITVRSFTVALARYPWRLLEFAWDNRIAGGGDRNRRFPKGRLKHTGRDPAQLYRETQGSWWTFFFRPQFRTQQKEKSPPGSAGGLFESGSLDVPPSEDSDECSEVSLTGTCGSSSPRSSLRAASARIVHDVTFVAVFFFVLPFRRQIDGTDEAAFNEHVRAPFLIAVRTYSARRGQKIATRCHSTFETHYWSAFFRERCVAGKAGQKKISGVTIATGSTMCSIRLAPAT
jgi:hypothetical protein